jgi:glycosyltransferase involved in cell wall biosynthesis
VSSTLTINQWIPAAHRGDAVGDNARAVRDFLRRQGHNSDIYAMTIDDNMAGEAVPWSDSSATAGDVTIYHYGVPSPMSERFGRLPGARVLQYHNVTPAHFFAPYDAAIARMCQVGREQLATLADRTDLGLGDSEFNRSELESMGFPSTDVLPIFVDTDRLRNAAPVPALEQMLAEPFVNILFVGRIVPNKKIEDHIRLAEHYKRYVDFAYRFIFVGRFDGVPRYYDAIRGLIAEYRMMNDRFWFTGPVPDAELAAYYRHAHAYVSLSEHEGFCVPLLEAMSMDVPVLAYGTTAVPETLGGAGVCFTPKDLEQAAELLGALVYDEQLRARVIAGQRKRLLDFSRERLEDRALAVLARVA